MLEIISYFLLFSILVSCNQNNEQLACSLAFEEIVKSFERDSLEINFDRKDFCQGWEDASELDELIFLIKGSPASSQPCIYCDIINNGGEVVFTENNFKYRDVPFIGDLFDSKSFEYCWGHNERICQKFNISFLGARCGNAEYIQSDSIETLLKRNITAQWDSSKIFILLDSTSFPLNFDSLKVSLHSDERIYKFPFPLLYKGYSLSTGRHSVGLYVHMNKYNNELYCHSYKENLDVLFIPIRDTAFFSN